MAKRTSAYGKTYFRVGRSVLPRMEYRQEVQEVQDVKQDVFKPGLRISENQTTPQTRSEASGAVSGYLGIPEGLETPCTPLSG
jgi:hypothetical protein